jgi:beta-lactamase superfamily II metal-dependent hydrolase
VAVVTNTKTPNLKDMISEGRISALLVPEGYEPKYEDSLIDLDSYRLYDNIAIDDKVELAPIATDGKSTSFVVRYDGEDILAVLNNDADEIDYEGRAACMKVAGGGAEGSVDGGLLDRVEADTVILSVKEHNKKGLPDAGVLELLERYGKKVLTTAENGAITVVLDKKGDIGIETVK